MVFAPSAGVVLADFGADVTKIEPLKTGDLNRHWHKIPGLPVSDMAYPFQVDNRNKKSIALDLKTDAGYEVFCRLIKDADVLITNYRLKALERLKLEYDDIKALNPKIIYALATGFGEQGDEKDKPGYDTVCYWSRSAIEQHIFPYEGWLAPFPYGAGDHSSGMALFGSIVTGLYQRQNTGEGCKVSTSLLANGTWSNSVMIQAKLAGATFKEKRPRDNAYNFVGLHYPTKDGRLIKMSMVNATKDWRPFCTAIARTDFLEDERFNDPEIRSNNMPTLIHEISETFAQHDCSYWQQVLDDHDVPYTVISSYDEAANDEQKRVNGIIVPLEHPEYGPMQTVSSPFEISGGKKRKPNVAPKLGEHTEEVLRDAGYSSEEIDTMFSAGVAE